MATRKSPIGYVEDDSAPENSKFNALTSSSIPPVTTYTKKAWNNPKTQTHERIHQGQFAAKLPRSENFTQQVRAALAGYPVINRSNPKQDFVELPAYAFSYSRERPEISDYIKKGYSLANAEKLFYDRKKSADSQQEAFNNYMNLVQKVAPGRRHNVMAPSPEELQKGYINSGPGVEGLTLPNAKEESLFSIIKRSLGGK